MDAMIGLMPPSEGGANGFPIKRTQNQVLGMVQDVPRPSYACLGDKYDVVEVVGSGSFGTAYTALDRSNGNIVAIKNVRVQPNCQIGIPSEILREVSSLRGLRHPNIVELIELIFIGVLEFTLVFAYEDNDLHRVLQDYRKQNQQMPMEMVRKYTSDMLNGLRACHCSMMIHRDLKPQNLLVGKGRLKISDFGLCRTFSMPIRSYTSEVVALWYRSPELLLGSTHYGPEIDMWSAGCIFSEMAVGSPTFPGDSEIGTIFKQFAMCGTPTEKSWPGLSALAKWSPEFPKWAPTDFKDILSTRPEVGQQGGDLLRGLLELNPAARITSRTAKIHPFVQGVKHVTSI